MIHSLPLTAYETNPTTHRLATSQAVHLGVLADCDAPFNVRERRRREGVRQDEVTLYCHLQLGIGARYAFPARVQLQVAGPAVVEVHVPDILWVP